MPKKIKKAIIAAAGYGTRFLPATKNVQKEMLPIIDKPVIQYLVDELVDSGIEEIIVVKRPFYHSVVNYFNPSPELEKTLEDSGKTEYLEMIRKIPKMAKFHFIDQDESLPYGNASPLLSAKHLIDEGEPLVYMFGDDLVTAKIPATKQLIDVFEKENPKGILAVQEVPWDEIYRYGSVKYKEGADYEYEMESMHEKLPKDEAYSNMAQFGRFVFDYSVYNYAEKQETGKDNELWLTDINNSMAADGQKVIAQPIEGLWLTTGDPLRFIKTTVKFALERDDLKEDLLRFLKEEIK
jgi:UTP--glucose-1-phosphate uridylyltransferase